MEEKEVSCYLKAGKIAKEVVDFAKTIVKPEMKLIDLALAIDDKIEELKGEPAFPVNLSLNEIAAHFTPELDDKTVAEGILKVDLGVAVDGFIADTAFSVDLTKEKKFGKMMNLNESILEKVSRKIKNGVRVYEVGETAQEILEDFNKKEKTDFSIIKSLSGHQLGQDKIHAGLTISNYRNENKTELKNIAFAIEPFVTSGEGDVYEGKGGGIYTLRRDLPARDRDSREVLKFIKENYRTRPFCLRWLDKMGFKKTKFTIANLVKQGILYEYPLLIEKSKAPVSQFEHTFVISDGEVWCTTNQN